MKYTIEELIAVHLSHTFKDGEVGFTGLATGKAAANYIANIPLAAMGVAKATFAPNLTILLAGWCINPDISQLTKIPESEYDTELMYLPCEAQMVSWPGPWSHNRGEIDFAFCSGAQVDQYGNVNSTVIGDPDKPKVALVGPIFVPEHMAIFNREYVMMPHHDKRNFVNHVDSITGVGFEHGRAGRKENGLLGAGPYKIYTPLCVFAFDEEGKDFVESIHPGVTKEQVIDNTGFNVGDLSGVPFTMEPTESELYVLRNIVDPNGLLLGRNE